MNNLKVPKQPSLAWAFFVCLLFAMPCADATAGEWFYGAKTAKPLVEPKAKPVWGFYAHRQINLLAIFTLPEPLFGFFRAHAAYVRDNAVNPDKRRGMDPEEACRHYIDADAYGDSGLAALPHRWDAAKAKYSEDTLKKYGIVPWHISLVRYRLVQAFAKKDFAQALHLATDLGHYIADANVPLHTTKNYDGQLTNQKGIHALWESRLPELFGSKYNFFVGPAQYLADAEGQTWNGVEQAYAALDSVLGMERAATLKLPNDEKYAFETRNNQTIKVYSKAFCSQYAALLGNQVERQMQRSVRLLGSIWLTAWLDAGQPDLPTMLGPELELQAPDVPATGGLLGTLQRQEGHEFDGTEK